MLFDEPHRPGLGRSGDGDRPHVGEEGVQGVELRAQGALDVVDRVDEPRVHLDLPATDDPDAARFAHPRLVVAVHVGAHGELGLLLDRGEELLDVLGVGQGVLAASDGAGDGAGLHPSSGVGGAADPDEHLRGGAHQVLALTEVEEELVGGGVAFAQSLVEAGRRGAAGERAVAGDDLEQVTAAEALLGLGDDLRVGAGHGPLRHLGGDHRRRGSGPSGHPLGRGLGSSLPRRDGELVGVTYTGLALAVADDDRVGQVQDQVAVGGVAVDVAFDVFELEGEVVAEGPVEAQGGVLGAAQGVDERAQGAEDAGAAAALLLGEEDVRVGFGDGHRDVVDPSVGGLPHGGHRLAQDGEQDPSAVVERGERHPSVAGGDLHAGVDVPEVPAVVAAGILHSRGEYAAASVLDRGDEFGEDLGIAGGDAAMDGHAARCAVRGGLGVAGLHGRSFGAFDGRGRSHRTGPWENTNDRRSGAVAVRVCELIGAPPKCGATTVR